MSTVLYCVKQGLKNFIRNPLFSMASVATVSACIFLFGIFVILASNLQTMLMKAENNVGITVFFKEGAGETEKAAIREAVTGYGGVKEIRYISADEAWADFSSSYFGLDAEEITAAFDGENPLSGSDSFEIYMNRIEDQDGMAAMLAALPDVREVNYASGAVIMLKKANSAVKWLSLIVIGILFAVSVFLISNTIHVSAAFRKRENEIMKMIGAKDIMIRTPFVTEGLFIGLLGALIPLVSLNIIYEKLSSWLEGQLDALTAGSSLKDVISPVPIGELEPVLLFSGLVLGLGMGYFVSLATINRHLRNMP